MSKHTIFVEFYYPSSIIDILSCTDDEQSKAVWSVIIDDDQDVHDFIDKAYEALKNNDYHWLHKHFV